MKKLDNLKKEIKDDLTKDALKKLNDFIEEIYWKGYKQGIEDLQKMMKLKTSDEVISFVGDVIGKDILKEQKEIYYKKILGKDNFYPDLTEEGGLFIDNK